MNFKNSLIKRASRVVWGIVLAGIGVISAKTFFSLSKFESFRFENTKKIESYWAESGISFAEVQALINNTNCRSSDRNKKACLSAIFQNAGRYDQYFLATEGKLRLGKRDLSDKTEKEFLASLPKVSTSFDFESALIQLHQSEDLSKRSHLLAKVLNAFLSIYSDPHSYIMPSDYFTEVSSKIERSKFFVGLSYEKKQGAIFVRKVILNSDAARAGIQANDQIIAINNFDTVNMSTSEVSEILRDESQGFFKFRILRNGSIKNIYLERSFQPLSHAQLDIKRFSGIGILTLSKFSRNACDEVRNHLKKVNELKISKLILDLRDNPGGLLSEAACIEGLFVGKDKKAYYVEYFDSEESNEVVLTNSEQVYLGQLTVLVNSSSASSAELLAGALQDYKRALIVGERTFGKGTFQEPEEWNGNSKITFFKTRGRYLLPSRRSTQLYGILPNIEIAGADLDKRREDSVYLLPVAASGIQNEALKNEDVLSRYVSVCESRVSQNQTEDPYYIKSISVLNCYESNEVADLAISKNGI